MTASQQKAVPGILGGLKPLAHPDFERKLIEKNVQRGARSDGEHPVWFLVSAADIAERTQSFLGASESCTPWLVKYRQLLHSAGADFIVVTCNTAHAFYAQQTAWFSHPCGLMLNLRSSDLARTPR